MYRVLKYLARQCLFRVGAFVQHWYVRSARHYSNFLLNRLERLDQFLAWRITFRHLFEPLYGDFSLIGYGAGFVFRLFRLIVGGIVYLVVFIFAIAAYLLWLIIPPVALLGIPFNL